MAESLNVSARTCASLSVHVSANSHAKASLAEVQQAVARPTTALVVSVAIFGEQVNWQLEEEEEEEEEERCKGGEGGRRTQCSREKEREEVQSPQPPPPPPPPPSQPQTQQFVICDQIISPRRILVIRQPTVKRDLFTRLTVYSC